MSEKHNPSAGERLTSKRQQDIMDAAIKVFSQKGFSGATTREIAKAAGVAEGTIFRYFKTKKDILLNVLGQYVVESLTVALDEVSGESDEYILKAILENRLNLISQNRDLVRLMFTEAQFHPEIRQSLIENIIMKAAGILEEFIAQRIRAGQFKEIDPRIAARMLVGMAGFFVIWRDFLQADSYVKFADQEVIAGIVDVFLNGIRKCTAGGSIDD